MYKEHTAKCDRIMLSSKHVSEGYELQTALLLRDRDGSPSAPVAMSPRAADGVHCSRAWNVREAASPLDELDPTMTFLEEQNFARPLVHIIDAEADSVFHFRQWSKKEQRYFLVRADDRIVEYAGREQRCSAIHKTLRGQKAFRQARKVLYRGDEA